MLLAIITMNTASHTTNRNNRGLKKMDKEIKSYEKKPYVVWRFVGYSMNELQSMASTMRSAGDGVPLVTNGKVRLRRGNHTDIITITKHG